ncbi:uncharacterized protein LOC125947210 [Dermacentor silvarum]|uniref:uncharacterized protein LOC125947210 n=1 Tax=Dermacentor silvarum TaxID=543639 RepID=UPI002100CABE|nr:uncharacterized protein LOC125947210 [Dermacentor silvarum]
MSGFRAHLSTHNRMLQRSRDVFNPAYKMGTKAILGLHLTKAFDNVSREAILTKLSFINPGECLFNCVSSFLTDRTADITLDVLKSGSIPLGSRGTPQGSVLLPFLFNLALITLPPKITAMPGLLHSFYTADITL